MKQIQILIEPKNSDTVEQIKWIEIKRSKTNKVLTTGHYWFLFGMRIGLIIKYEE